MTTNRGEPKFKKSVFRDYISYTYSLPDGRLHHETKPARLDVFDECQKIEEWIYEGYYHRYGGPAYYNNLKDNESGSVISEYLIHGNDVTFVVEDWLKEHGYVWATMSDVEKWELDMFMRSLG